MSIKHETEGLAAIADFIDWLCDHGYVIAKHDGDSWTPISEDEADKIAAKWLSK